MTPDQFKAIRIKHFGEGSDARSRLAKVLRIKEVKSIYRYEHGERAISGPVSLLMEMIDDGRL